MPPLRWDILENLSSSEVAAILSLAQPITLREGEELFSLGDDADRVFLVVHGLVKLTLPLTVGDNRLDAMVGERMPGHLVGWSGLIPPHRFTVKASAAENTELLALTRAPLLSHFEGRPEVGHTVYSNLARIVGQRLQVFQTLWIREMQHVVKAKTT